MNKRWKFLSGLFSVLALSSFVVTPVSAGNYNYQNNQHYDMNKIHYMNMSYMPNYQNMMNQYMNNYMQQRYPQHGAAGIGG